MDQLIGVEGEQALGEALRVIQLYTSSSTSEIGPEGWITPDFAEFAVSACNYPAIKKAGEEATPSPPDRKKKALSLMGRIYSIRRFYTVLFPLFSPPFLERVSKPLFPTFPLDSDWSILTSL